MRIVHLAPLYYPHVGGIEKHLYLLNKELTLRGHSITVVTQLHNQNLLTSECIENTKIIRLKTLHQTPHYFQKIKYKWLIWKAILSQYKLLRSADSIHIHDVFWWILPLLPLLDRKKIYITFHGYEGADAPNWRQILWHKLAAWYTQANLCVGDFHKKWYQLQPSLVTYGAVENLVQKNKLKLHTDTTYSDPLKCIYIGRLSADSGIATYLQALTYLQEKNISCTLAVYGDGEQMQLYKSYCSTHQLKVRFHGAVENAAVQLHKYDIAFVSRYLAILEALSVGMPILAQYNNQIKFDYLALAPFKPWITIVQSPHEICDAITKLVAAKVRKDQPLAAKQWIEKQSWARMADTYEQLWKL